MTKPKKPLGLCGPIVYCPQCLRKIGIYNPGRALRCCLFLLTRPAVPARLNHGRTAKHRKIVKPGSSGPRSGGPGRCVPPRLVCRRWVRGAGEVPLDHFGVATSAVASLHCGPKPGLQEQGTQGIGG